MRREGKGRENGRKREEKGGKREGKGRGKGGEREVKGGGMVEE